MGEPVEEDQKCNCNVYSDESQSFHAKHHLRGTIFESKKIQIFLRLPKREDGTGQVNYGLSVNCIHTYIESFHLVSHDPSSGSALNLKKSLAKSASRIWKRTLLESSDFTNGSAAQTGQHRAVEAFPNFCSVTLKRVALYKLQNHYNWSKFGTMRNISSETKNWYLPHCQKHSF